MEVCTLSGLLIFHVYIVPKLDINLFVFLSRVLMGVSHV